MRWTLLVVALTACDTYEFDPNNVVDAVPSGDSAAEDTRTKKEIVNAFDDELTIHQGEAVTFDPTENDYGRRLTIVEVGTPDQGGTVKAVARREVEYQSDPAFSGTETFDYTIEDRYDEQSTGTVSVTVLPLPSIEITGPKAGAQIKGTEVEVSFTVTGCTVSRPGNDECHIHMYIDDVPYSYKGEGRGHYDPNPRLLRGLAPGSHTIQFRMVKNDGSDDEFRPVISDSVEVTLLK